MKEKGDSMQILKRIFFFFLISVFCYFVAGEIFLPVENAVGGRNCEVFESEWVRVYPNGTREIVEIPGKTKAERNEAILVETTLPEELEDGICLCFRSSQQDMEIYIDGILRQRYCTKDSRPFGKSSMSAYVFADLNSSDAGKKIRVIMVSASTYTGQLNQIYIGNKSEIWNNFLYTYGFENLTAAGIILLSVIVILVSMLLSVCYHKKLELNYLGWGTLLTATWIIAESKLRQFLLPNNSVFGSMAFFAIMLIPFPFLIYMDSIQHKRYQKRYIILGGISTGIFVGCTGLQVFNIVDFLDTLFLMNGMLLLCCLVVGMTMIKDAKNGELKEYRSIAMGAVGIIISCCVEIIWVYQNAYQLRGVMISCGLVFLLFMASIKTAKDLMEIEKETSIALMVGKSKADFLANMSHEIRTPINTIVGMNEMVLRESADEDILQYAENIQRASNMLLALIDDVLDFSKIDAGKLEIVEDNYKINTLLQDVVQVLDTKAEQKGLKTTVRIMPDIPKVLYGDEIRIKQILHNLVTNAVKYTPQGSVSLYVQGEEKEDGIYWLTMSVEDTGMGIKEEDRKNLFESFTRLEQDKNRSIQGTGLGLSITKKLVELMHGTIAVESTYGKGSIFTVILPQKLVSEEVCQKVEKMYAENTAMQDDVNGSDKAKMRETVLHKREASLYAPDAKVLVVDDNDMNLAVVKALLKRTAINLDMASSGKECLQYCNKQKYDLILMDHMMPEMDGIETLYRLRQQNDNPNTNTKVIALTANAIAGSRDMYLEKGFVDYLSKPIDAIKLEVLLSKYLAMETTVEEMKVQEVNYTEEGKSNQDSINASLINKESAMPYCCNNEEFFGEMLKIYHEQGQKYKKQLPEYYEQRDWTNYAVIVHAIKSTSLTIGANTLSNRAKQHEMEAKNNNEDFIKNDWDDFYAYYCVVLELAEKMLAE